MNKITVILLLLVYLFSTTELSQLLKVPVLITHFIEHKNNDENMTFWGFLVHHYGGHEKDADWDTDMKLPFMQHADLLNVLVVPPNGSVFLTKSAGTYSTENQFVFYKDKHIPSSYLDAIWQPPKSC